MEIVRLRRPRHSSSKVEELLESYISQSELVPKGSYRIRELDSVERILASPYDMGSCPVTFSPSAI